MKKPGERAHSKFSASGADRWFNCPGSVELSEGQPDKTNAWALEGTEAHAILERIMKGEHVKLHEAPKEMINYGAQAAGFIKALGRKLGAEVTIENRVFLDFIHPEMFGTTDSAVIEHFGTLHVFDYKYGAGHAVSPKENLQMIFYGIAMAHLHHWNFTRVRLWIIQPRIKGYDGPVYWEIGIDELYAYVEKFQTAVDRVLANPTQYIEGSWCHWCKAKSVCPLKRESKLREAQNVFAPFKKGTDDGIEEESKEESDETETFVTEAEWRKKARKGKSKKEKTSDAKSKRRSDVDNKGKKELVADFY